MLTAPITVEVLCLADPSKKHQVTINPDWSVPTTLDLEAERVAVALGADAPCTAIGDAVDAVRLLIRLQQRRQHYPIIRLDSGRWAAKVTSTGPLRRKEFNSVTVAATCMRTPLYVADLRGVSALHTFPIFSAIGWDRSEGMFDASRFGPCERYVDSISDLRTLWAAGVNPVRLPRLWHLVGEPERPLRGPEWVEIAYGASNPMVLPWMRRFDGTPGEMVDQLRQGHNRIWNLWRQR